MNKNQRFMGTIKFELDLPEFEKNIELRVIINKDGVQECTSPLVIDNNVSSIPSITHAVEAWNRSSISSSQDVGVGQSQAAVPNKTYSQSPTPGNIPSSMMGNY